MISCCCLLYSPECLPERLLAQAVALKEAPPVSMLHSIAAYVTGAAAELTTAAAAAAVVHLSAFQNASLPRP
jgi:hypothetical protein